jgi:PKD repeat protein
VYWPHEDWWLHDRDDGSRFMYGRYGWYHMDVASPGWREEFARHVLSHLTANYDGALGDDCWRDIAYTQGTDRLTRVSDATYGHIPDAKVASFHNDQAEMLRYVKGRFGSRLLYFNGLHGGGTYTDYLAATDGAWHEEFLHGGTKPVDWFPTYSTWQELLERLVYTQSAGKTITCYNRYYVVPPADIEQKGHFFSLATYLLGCGPTSYFDHIQEGLTLETSYYPIWDAAIGTPTGAYYQAGGVYQRDFTNGKALVNPLDSGNAVTVTLSRPYRVVAYDGSLSASVTSVSLATKTGVILIQSPLEKRACSFTFTPQDPVAGQQVSFEDQSSDPSEIVSWHWDFGDGAASSDQNPSHAYGDPGSYNVSLQITYNDGQEASCSQQLSVNSSTPAAEFSWQPPSPGEGQAVQFSDQSAGGGPKGAIVAWAWDFGDGGRAEVASPTHVFVDNGNYSVNLTVTNSYGLTASIAQVVSVHNLAPTCDAGPARVVQVGEQVTFTGQAVDPGVLDILSFSWDFGDGSSTTGQLATHIYEKPGVYRVTLRVVDKDAAEGIDWTSIQVGTPAPMGPPSEPALDVPIQAEYDGDAASGPDGGLNLSARLTKAWGNAANPFWPARAVFSLITPRGDLAGRFYADIVESSSGDEAAARVSVQLPPGVYFAWVEVEDAASCDSEQEPFALIAVGADRNAIWGASRSLGDGQLSAAISVWDLDTAHPRAEVIYCVRGPAGSLRVFTGTSIQALSAADGRVEISGVSAADGVHGLPFGVTADVFSSSLTIALADGTSASGTLDAGASTAP